MEKCVCMKMYVMWRVVCEGWVLWRQRRHRGSCQESALSGNASDCTHANSRRASSCVVAVRVAPAAHGAVAFCPCRCAPAAAARVKINSDTAHPPPGRRRHQRATTTARHLTVIRCCCTPEETTPRWRLTPDYEWWCSVWERCTPSITNFFANLSQRSINAPCFKLWNQIFCLLTFAPHFISERYLIEL